jgi:hypothetical protein
MSTRKRRQRKKNDSNDVDNLLDETILNTSGLNNISGGSLDESLNNEDPNYLSNLMAGGYSQF